jgi:hypothetical protein
MTVPLSTRPTRGTIEDVGRGIAATTAEAKAREPAARGARGASRTAAAGIPNARIDALVGDLTPAGLAELDRRERAHQNRAGVLRVAQQDPKHDAVGPA